ncbi:uncharacterized protein M437DRAFT_89250 [Aureobasidium melanogenum CBS 110374]|uniref:Uncharacterized protein n=1 Tax=Aureobasidium melanogenum (strain CBS 110374) TaxID=1043003 RepID=A0A074VJA0_AURM1|nr:uncharacterized protein M437DRAFT_89250 [Aureobasidium melanogenum CBS 110374]KEQ57677.1 hypothetical protein M437DRAFT_89250 [Aureobasidium melanogenum CBS 110374]
MACNVVPASTQNTSTEIDAGFEQNLIAASAAIDGNNDDTALLRKAWILKFISHNPEVASGIGRRSDTAGLNGTHPEAMLEFYQRFKPTRTAYDESSTSI